MRLLGGDIGGTHSRFELFEYGHGQLHSLVQAEYQNRDFGQFSQVLQAFYEQHQPGSIDAACFAIAGPVDSSNTLRLTNLDWYLESQPLQARFHIPRVEFINDFAAIPYGVDSLRLEDFVCLQEGELIESNAMQVRSFIGAGTGLGQATSVAIDGRLYVLPSEGGHADFAPASEEQRRLLHHYAEPGEVVDTETFLSGRGLVRIYLALAEFRGETEVLPLSLDDADAPARISAAAEQRQPLALRSIDLFWQICAAHAGNVALHTLARGGIYLAGDIAPKLLPFLRADEFSQHFCRKQAMQSLLWQIPVYVIRHPGVARIGAAHYLIRQLA